MNSKDIGGLVVREDKISAVDTNYRYFVLSLPDKYFYTKLLQFPLNLSRDEIDEFIHLNAGLILPLAPDEIYIDWGKINSLKPEYQEYSLFIARKAIIDSYLDKMDKDGFKVVAVEPHILSFLRSSHLSNESNLVLNFDGENLSSAIIENKSVRFLRNTNFAPENLLDEILRLFNFYKFRIIFTIGFNDELNQKITHALSGKIEVKALKPDVLLVPRTDDTAISLMSMGMEEAYENKKAAVFSEFISRLIIGISVFFILLFGGSYFFLFLLDKKVEQNLNKLGAISEPMARLENIVKDFNSRVALMVELEKLNPQWSLLLEEVRKLNLPGITFNRFNNLSLQGTAQSQQELLRLKTVLENSPYFSNVEIPLSDLTLKQNFGFSFTFNIKDPKWIQK